MNLNDRIPIEIEVGTLATLIAGLYSVYSNVSPIAIPSSLYIEIAEKIVPHLKEWDYERISFEKWVETSLLIIPRVLCTDEDIESFKENEVYFERENGKVILIVTFEV